MYTDRRSGHHQTSPPQGFSKPPVGRPFWKHYLQGSCGKVMFSHLSVILSTGGVWQTPPGRHPHPLSPQADTPQADTPQADTPILPPLGQTPPRQTPQALWADTPQQTPHGQTPSQRTLPLDRHPPAQCMLGYTSLSSACWDAHPPVQCMLGYTSPCPVHDGIHAPHCVWAAISMIGQENLYSLQLNSKPAHCGRIKWSINPWNLVSFPTLISIFFKTSTSPECHLKDKSITHKNRSNKITYLVASLHPFHSWSWVGYSNLSGCSA